MGLEEDGRPSGAIREKRLAGGFDLGHGAYGCDATAEPIGHALIVVLAYRVTRAAERDGGLRPCGGRRHGRWAEPDELRGHQVVGGFDGHVRSYAMGWARPDWPIGVSDLQGSIPVGAGNQ